MFYKTLNDNPDIEASVVTIGKFDGNHIGHQKLFNIAQSLKETGMSAVILTFNQEISKVSNFGKEFIFTSFEKETYEYPSGIDYVVECDFEDIKGLSPEEFAEKILHEKLHAKKVVVGTDFRFGKERKGNVKSLKELGNKLGFEVFAIEKVEYNGREVSSTYIKEEIKKGNMKAAADMMGEPFFVTGVVEEGKKLGNTIGFPTINFSVPKDKILPPDGVYAAKIKFDNENIKRYGITNVGIRPTVSQNGIRTIETNIFDFDKNVYGQRARVEFYDYIRPEKKFDSIEELRAEIDRNKQTVKKIFGVRNREETAL